jgi:hypothetical protein
LTRWENYEKVALPLSILAMKGGIPMTRKIKVFGAFLLPVALASAALAQEGRDFVPSGTFKPIPAGSKVFVATMDGGFETYLTAGLVKKKVPVVVVTDKDQADFEISGISTSEKAGWAKLLFTSSDASNEEASIKVVDLKTGSVVFAYSVHKHNSARGKQSAAEACAKHINQKMRTE